MASLKSEILGHEDIFKNAETILRSELSAGCFLFTGPEGVGKKLIATALIQNLACEHGIGCGTCGTCSRVAKNTYEGMLVIEPTQNLIKIDEAQKIKEFLRLRSLSEKRFILIDDAHTLNIPASNSLLKIFEEPPVGTFIFLISSQPRGLLTTIRSRCRVFRCGYLNPMNLKALLQRNGWHTKNFLQRGQVHWIKNAVENSDDAAFVFAFELLDMLLTEKNIFENSEWRIKIKDKSLFQNVIFNSQMILRDLLVLRFSPDSEEILLGGYRSQLNALMVIPIENIFELQDRLVRLIEGFKWSPDPVLAIESLSFQMNENEAHR